LAPRDTPTGGARGGASGDRGAGGGARAHGRDLRLASAGVECHPGTLTGRVR
jgi:hypothetical protein